MFCIHGSKTDTVEYAHVPFKSLQLALDDLKLQDPAVLAANITAKECNDTQQNLSFLSLCFL